MAAALGKPDRVPIGCYDGEVKCPVVGPRVAHDECVRVVSPQVVAVLEFSGGVPDRKS